MMSYREWEWFWGLQPRTRWVLVSLVALLIGGVVVSVALKRSEFEQEAIAKARPVCDEEIDPGPCWDRHDARHEECFRVAYDSGGRFSAASVNHKAYQRCLEVGAEAYRVERRRKRQEAHEAARRERALMKH